MKKIEDEVVEVLKNPDAIDFEDIQDEELSPLNKAVIEKEIAGVSTDKSWNIWKHGKNVSSSQTSGSTMKNEYGDVAMEAPLDAPEQEIGEDYQENPIMDDQEAGGQQSSKEEFELPTDMAKKAADTLLGMTNNVLTVGGGFFVKIRKHKEFYDFDEIPELIDAQNQKNIDRIKLDKEDKALLKPPLVEVLKKKAKSLTPGQQLMGAAFSIAMKKAQNIIEIKAENELLVDRIVDIIREEKAADSGFESATEDKDILDKAYEDINGAYGFNKNVEEEKEDAVIEEEYDEESRMESGIIEVADDSTTAKTRSS